MTSIENLIEEKGPFLSEEIIKIIEKEEPEASKDAIRQRLTRLNVDIYKLKGYFNKGQIFFYHKDIYGSPEFFETLINSLKKSGKQYYYLLNALDYHYGYLEASHLATYGVNPVINIIGHLNFETAIKNLLSLKLISVQGDYIELQYNLLKNNSNERHSKGIETAKSVLLLQFNDWSRNLGLTSYDKSKFFSEYGGFQFAFVAPSYISTITNFKNGKLLPGFILADVLIGNKITKEEIEFYIKKIDILKARKGLPAFLPFLLVDRLELDALNELKSKGIIIGFINELFGQQYVDLLQSLINIMTNAGAILKKNPEEFLTLMAKLTKLVEGKTNNLRGDLFELAVGYFHGKQCNILDIGKLINFNGKVREMDIYAVYADKIIVAECKGYNNEIQKDEVDKWLGQKIPIIRNWIIDQPSIKDKNLIFEFWSTGGFSLDAEALLKDKQSKTTKYKIEYFTKNEMIEKSKEVDSKKFTDILREYFIKEV